MAERKPRTPTKDIAIPFPVKGLSENLPRERQPERTTPEMSNVRVFDPSEDRARGGQREGISKYITDAVNGTNQLQNLNQVTVARANNVVFADTLLFSDNFTGVDGVPIAQNASPPNPSTKWFEKGNNNVSTGNNSFPNLIAGAPISSSRFIFSSNRATADFSTGTPVPSNTHAARSIVSEVFFTASDRAVLRANITTFTPVDNFPLYQMGIFFRGKTGLTISESEAFFACWETGGVISPPGGGLPGKYRILLMAVDSNGPHTGVPAGGSFIIGETTFPFADTDFLTHTMEVRINLNEISVVWDGAEVINKSVASVGFDSVDHKQHGIAYVRWANTASFSETSTPNRFDDYRIFSGVVPATLRSIQMTAISGGDLFVGDKANGLNIPVGGSDAVDDNVPLVETAYAFQTLYIVDGKTYTKYDAVANEATPWVASGTTTLPGGNGGALDGIDRCRYIALYRGRIVLSGKVDEPHLWFMSAIGDPDEWNTGSGGAFSASTSGFGTIGDTITALIPFYDARLIFGADKSIWVLTEDPASVNPAPTLFSLSREVGVLGPRAWAEGPERAVFIMGTNGLYMLRPNDFNIQQANRISTGRLDKTFGDLNILTHEVQLEWDQQRYGLHIFVTPRNEAETTHYFWDQRTESFSEQRIPSNFGPTATHIFSDDDPANRGLLLGGFDSFVRVFDTNATDDDGDAISSTMLLGPIQSPWPGYELRLRKLQAVLDEQSDDLSYELIVADTAEQATTATASVEGTFSAGRNGFNRERVRGSSIFIRLKNSTINKTWQLESLNATIEKAGIARSR